MSVTKNSKSQASNGSDDGHEHEHVASDLEEKDHRSQLEKMTLKQKKKKKERDSSTRTKRPKEKSSKSSKTSQS